MPAPACEAAFETLACLAFDVIVVVQESGQPLRADLSVHGLVPRVPPAHDFSGEVLVGLFQQSLQVDVDSLKP